jgi:predicted DNA-binding transcriptional regulator AlpA
MEVCYMTQLINKQEAAAILGISPFSINRLMRELPYVRVGARRVMFDPRDVQAYIEARKVQPRQKRGNGE